ncbi:MAG: glycine oxidase ThiO [Thermosynechococcaceae cyanobacterium]
MALKGASVTILSRNGQEAALQAAAGMLAPQAEALLPGPMLDLCLRSRALYPEWTQKLESLTGLDPEYWPCGIIAPQYAPDRMQDPYPAIPISAGRRDWCDRPHLDTLQPGLSEAVVGGWWFPEDGQVNNQKMAQVLRLAVQQLGVKLREGITIQQINHNSDQVTGVETTDGLYQASHYVLATGAWAGDWLQLPVVPRKGQMLSLRWDKTQQPLQHVLFGSEVYVVPRQNGRILIGATSESVGFMPHNTAVGVQHLLRAAICLYPILQDWILEQCWWGFRPTTPDELPILGPSPYSNLVIATGHHRNGILLAPVTARLLSILIIQNQLDPLIQYFQLSRFEKSDMCDF